ncbi:MAG: sensor histidine kinase, partial [Longimicrobiales bacterium]
RALAESARADAARIRLLRGITHDVKNPLGAAQGYAELLAMGIKAPLLPEQAPLVAGVQRSVDSALAIIADLLDVARAESGGLTVNRVRTDLVEVARLAVADHRPSAETAGHTLHLETPHHSVTVYTDPARVRQVLDNLLSNAIKYTPASGRITVRTAIEGGDGAERDWAFIEVADTGPGIPRELRETIFDEFTRLDAHEGMKGHGLGLAIARRIARLLDGDIALRDTTGPGAAFVLRLPMRKESSL